MNAKNIASQNTLKEADDKTEEHAYYKQNIIVCWCGR